jgi:hypothetical protein
MFIVARGLINTGWLVEIRTLSVTASRTRTMAHAASASVTVDSNDISSQILEHHARFKRDFATLRALRSESAPAKDLAEVSAALFNLLDVHAAAEEEVFYPVLLQTATSAKKKDEIHETDDAIR